MPAEPRVSILVVCKDAARTIRRCLDSLVRQDYRYVEIVVQDGASTDGTLDVLRSYGDRLDIVSAPDADQNDAFIRGLQRCTGDIVGFSWADEELLPNAARWAVHHLGKDPELGGIYGKFIETDLDGKGSTVVDYPPWDFERVYSYQFIPPVCSSFFRRACLEATYLRWYDASRDATEFVLWASVGSRFKVQYVPEPISKYARHSTQLSMRPERVAAYPEHVVTAVTRLARNPELPEVIRRLQGRACAGVHMWAAQWLLTACGAEVEAKRHLAAALRYDPEPKRLTAMVWDCYAHYLNEGRRMEALSWLDLLASLGVTLPATHLARAVTLFGLGCPVEAEAEAAGMVGAADAYQPHIDLAHRLHDVASGRGDLSEARYCLELFRRLGVRLPRALFAMAIVLFNLGRHEDALEALDEHHSRMPDDHEARELRRQLQVVVCAKRPEVRRTLARLFDRSSMLPVDKSLHFADGLRQVLSSPAMVRELAPQAIAPLQQLMVVFREAAQRSEMHDLAHAIAALQGELSQRLVETGTGAPGV